MGRPQLFHRSSTSTNQGCELHLQEEANDEKSQCSYYVLGPNGSVRLPFGGCQIPGKSGIEFGVVRPTVYGKDLLKIFTPIYTSVKIKIIQ